MNGWTRLRHVSVGSGHTITALSYSKTKPSTVYILVEVQALKNRKYFEWMTWMMIVRLLLLS